MKSVEYHPHANHELAASSVFYEQRRKFLGSHFLDSVEKTLGHIQIQPEMGKPGKFKTRSWKVRRFPFRVVYREQSDQIWIVAIAHLSRKPNYWLERLD